MKPITTCFVYFKSLTLANLRASLFTLQQQNFEQVENILFLDNNTPDSQEAIQGVLNEFQFPVPLKFVSIKHGDPTKTHSWSVNFLHREAGTPWIFFTRADYLIAPNTIELFASQMRHPMQFIIGGYYGLDITIEQCEQHPWRAEGLQVLHPFGKEYGHGLIDVGGVWLTTKQAFETVGGLDERLWAWGHQQTLFQYNLYKAGVEFVRVPQLVFYHAEHEYDKPRSHALAKQQLQEVGADIYELWARHDQPDNPYRRR